MTDIPIKDTDPDEWKDPAFRATQKATIFLSYTSNMISCGVRETILFLVKNKLVDCLVTSAGGIEEDFIKCLAPTFLGDFKLKGSELRLQGVNRIGNLLIPNENYCLFEDFVMPILNKMADEQDIRKDADEGVRWTPSKIINRLGKEINDENSVYYWCWKNDIPVYCPGITDGSLGDMMYFFSYRRPEFIVDLIGDIRGLNNTAVRAHATGMIILGGGIIKHHTCNANLMRNGANYSVFINTGQVQLLISSLFG
jgi:deoxyhypusine synthase